MASKLGSVKLWISQPSDPVANRTVTVTVMDSFGNTGSEDFLVHVKAPVSIIGVPSVVYYQLGQEDQEVPLFGGDALDVDSSTDRMTMTAQANFVGGSQIGDSLNPSGQIDNQPRAQML